MMEKNIIVKITTSDVESGCIITDVNKCVDLLLNNNGTIYFHLIEAISRKELECLIRNIISQLKLCHKIKSVEIFPLALSLGDKKSGVVFTDLNMFKYIQFCFNLKF